MILVELTTQITYYCVFLYWAQAEAGDLRTGYCRVKPERSQNTRPTMLCKLRLASTPYIWWIPLIPMIERSCAWILVYIRDRSWPGGPRTYTVLGNPTAPSSVAEIVVRSTASEPSSAGSMSSPGKTSPLPCLAGLSPWSRIASRGPCWWTRACTRTMRRGQHVGHRRGRGPA